MVRCPLGNNSEIIYKSYQIYLNTQRNKKTFFKDIKMSLDRTGNGYLVDPTIWSEDIMYEMAKEDDYEITDEIKGHILKAREYYDENASVPPIRTFSKYVEQDKKDLFKVYLGGPMKFITKYGGLPQPTGCV